MTSAGADLSTLDVCSVVPRLLEWGLLDEASIVAGALEITSVARRNRNLRVTRKHGSGYLIKQPEPGGDSHRRSLKREARFYTWCRSQDLPTFNGFVPRLEFFQPEEGILVIELLPGARSLWSAYQDAEQGPAAEKALVDLGCALGSLHADLRDSRWRADPFLAELPSKPPWVLSVHRPEVEILRQLSPAKRQLLQIVQNDQGMSDSLDLAREMWQVETIIHGDVRSDNVLVLADGAAIRLVDWELVQRGDPAWDVGGAFQDILLFWLDGQTSSGNETEGEGNAPQVTFAALRSLLGAFWRSYLSASRIPAAAELERRAVPFSGARLIQSAWELSAAGDRLSRLAVLALQVGANVLADPRAAAADLYGLESEPLVD